MEFQEMKEQLVALLLNKTLIQATISQPRLKSNELKRVKLKPVELRGDYMIQLEYQYERILKHENLPLVEVAAKLDELFEQFRQAHAEFTEQTVQIQLSKKNKVLFKSNASDAPKQVNLTHNRKKHYLLDESRVHPFLVRLGVQAEDGKIKKQKYDKFKQINRFVEFIDDSLAHLPKDKQIRILDFGSGKSYLTFALYHYLKVEKGLNIRVTGLDLKKEVIEEIFKNE